LFFVDDRKDDGDENEREEKDRKEDECVKERTGSQNRVREESEKGHKAR
jgi:hypothetical protein